MEIFKRKFVPKKNKKEADIMEILSINWEEIGNMDAKQLKQGFKAMQKELSKKTDLNLGAEITKECFGNQLKEQTAKRIKQAELAKLNQTDLENVKTEKGQCLLHLGRTKEELSKVIKLRDKFKSKCLELEDDCEKQSATIVLFKDELDAMKTKFQADLDQKQKMLIVAKNSLEEAKAENISILAELQAAKNNSSSLNAVKNLQIHENCQLLEVIEEKPKSTLEYSSERSSKSHSGDEEIQFLPKYVLPVTEKPSNSPSSFIKTSHLCDDVSTNSTAAAAPHNNSSQKVVNDAKKKKNSAMIKGKKRIRYTVISSFLSF